MRRIRVYIAMKNAPRVTGRETIAISSWRNCRRYMYPIHSALFALIPLPFLAS